MNKSRVAIKIVEIDIEVCSLEYGVSPCQATIPTGGQKCFNCATTCQDEENFTPETVTLRFIMDNGLTPKWIEAIPCLVNAQYSSAVVSLGEDLGTRASLALTFTDFKHSDAGVGFDKYRDERDYNPYEQGTFWGKFRSRQLYLRGQAVRYITGLMPSVAPGNYPVGTPLPEDILDEQETHHFVVESFDGLNTDGTFSVVAKDVLKLADGDRAQAPRLSEGRLASEIAADANAATLTPAGIGNAEYPSHGYLNIGGNEIVFFGRDPYSGVNANTQLLVHLDGANTSTTITDSSGNGRSGSCQGNAQLSTTRGRYGQSGAIFDGAGDFISFSDNAAWTFAGDFCLDLWFNPDDLLTDQALISHSSNATSNFYAIWFDTNGALHWQVVSSSVDLIHLTSANGLVKSGEYQHVAISREGDVWRLFLNGEIVATQTINITIPGYSSTLKLGMGATSSTMPFKGAIDEARVQGGEAFYTADFSEMLPGAYAANSDLLSITRAQKGTVASSHSANDRAQLVLSYFGVDPALIIQDLLVNYADVPAEQIPIEDWLIETQSFLNQVLTADIAEPVAVNQLVSEIIKQCALTIWTDEKIPEVKLKVLRAVSEDATLYDRTEYMLRTPEVREQPDKRISQVWTYYAMRNPTEKDDDPNNFRSAVVSVDSETELNYGSPVIEKIFSRWIPLGGRIIAEAVNDIILSRFRFPPRKVSFSLFRLTSKKPELGMSCNFAHLSVQNADGSPALVPLQITRTTPGDTQYDVEAEELQGGAQVVDLTNRVLYIDSDTRNVNVRALHDSIYQTLTDQDVIDGVTLTTIVSEGVVIGSVDTSSVSIDFGASSDWPTGLPIYFEVRGTVAGHGGEGRRGAGFTGSSGYPAFAGLPGGPAVKTRVPVFVRVKPGGKVGGGGGGGGGGAINPSQPSTGGGGGGGAGDEVGGVSGNRLGDPGTLLEGGAGRNGSAGAFKGGDGGDLGQPGNQGAGQPGNAGALGGAPGNSIDGISYCTITEGDAEIVGPRIN